MSKHHDPGHADETPDVSDIANPDVSHEGSDVNVGTVFKFIGVLFVSTLVIMLVVRWMAGYLLQRELSEEVAPVSKVNPPGTQRLPPMPRLQGAPGSVHLPEDDLKKFREEQETAGNSYGWVDKQAGVVRIPIEEAKRLIQEAQGRSELLLEKTQSRVEDVQREIDGLRLKRRDVETSIESIMQTLRNALEFVREQEARDREDKILLHRPRHLEQEAKLG